MAAFVQAAVLVILVATCTSGLISDKLNQQNIKNTDCHERWLAGERTPGLHTVYLNKTNPVEVLCNFTDKASFVVIQRRVDHSLSFYRGWQDYKRGFGDSKGNYWAGLDMIHHLTNTGYNTLRIDLSNWSGNSRYITYNHFLVQDESRFYEMSVSPPSQGNIPDDMGFSSGMRFATFDYYDKNRCAINQKAGWWYNYCSYALLNGVYYYGGPYTPSGSFYDGIFWKDWLGYAYSLKFASMTLYKY